MPQNIYNKFSDFEDNEQILLNENKGDWSEDNIKKLLTNIIEDKYVEDVAKSLIKFRQEASNYDTECALAFDSKFKQIGELIVSSGRGDVNLPKETIDEAGEDGFGMVMHSHTSEVPLPSAGDIETGGLNLKVKYNFIVTQDNGFAILKNKDFNEDSRLFYNIF